MGLFNRKKQEIRADPVSFEDALLQSLLGNTAMTKKLARQIPTVSGAIDLIGNIIAGTPVKLYEEKDGKATPVKGDPRISLLNDDTRDTLNAHDFWKAIVDDYFYGKGGYAYIKKSGGKYESIHYVDEAVISINMKVDPIFKDYDILVNGADITSLKVESAPSVTKKYVKSRCDAYGITVPSDYEAIEE